MSAEMQDDRSLLQAALLLQAFYREQVPCSKEYQKELRFWAEYHENQALCPRAPENVLQWE
jgi:hypothetical protein